MTWSIHGVNFIVVRPALHDASQTNEKNTPNIWLFYKEKHLAQNLDHFGKILNSNFVKGLRHCGLLDPLPACVFFPATALWRKQGIREIKCPKVTLTAVLFVIQFLSNLFWMVQNYPNFVPNIFLCKKNQIWGVFFHLSVKHREGLVG